MEPYSHQLQNQIQQITETEKPIERNEKLVEIKLNVTNIKDNKKARKKIRSLTYSEVVTQTADKDMGEKITNL